jgi:GT2 family glycosyltransferase
MEIAVVLVPYISSDEHLRLAKESVESFRSSHELKIYTIVNNFRDWNKDIKWLEDLSVMCVKNHRNNLSLGWNRGIKKAMQDGLNYILVPNLDVRFFPDTIDKLLDFTMNADDNMVLASSINVLSTGYVQNNNGTPTPTPDFSNFMITKKTIDRIGWFDASFEPCYYEDNDYHRRIILAEQMALQTPTSQYIHYGSQTIKNDLQLEQKNIGTFRRNQIHYVAKWGGLPGQERFSRPFNGACGGC